ncbi:MAG TPA: MFS transporter [Terracidiphilus sp.]|nr:MFS transporter [Terracidiphilus sp.]
MIEAASRQRWKIALLLGAGVLVNYFDRVNLTVSHDALTRQFAISDITFGFLLSAYNWTYASLQLPSGWLLDRFGVRLIGCIGSFLWGVASMAAAAAQNIAMFFGARFLLGIGEAPTFPANAKAIGYWFPPRERSLATSLFDGAAKFSSAIGVPLIGLMLLHIGWRLSFAVTGVLSFIFFFAFWKIYHDPPAGDSFRTEKEEDSAQLAGEQQLREKRRSERVGLGYLIRQRKVLGLAIGFGSYNYIFYMFLTWLPVYLSRSLHIDLEHSFLYTGVPWLVATVGELIVGGWLVDKLIRKKWHADRVRRVVLIGGTAMGLGLLGAIHAHTAAVALFWLSVSIGGLSIAAPVGWSVPSLIAPGDSVGSVGGILNFSNQISGIAAPIITGFLVNGRQSFAAAFSVAIAYLVIGILAYIFLLGEIKEVPHPAHAE